MAGSLTIDNINGKVISSSPVATESQVIGVGQTWQDVTSSRVLGVTYTNSTGKPIYLSIWGIGTSTSAYNLTITIDGTVRYFNQDYANSAGYSLGATMIISNGETYTVVAANLTLTKWMEKR